MSSTSRPASLDELRNAVAEVKASIVDARRWTVIWLLVAAGAALVFREVVAADRARRIGARKPARRSVRKGKATGGG
jgi:hypothetical protein